MSQGVPNELGLYVVVRNLSMNAAWAGGLYEVRWVASLSNLDPKVYEVVEVSINACAAEWSRLVDVKDSLMAAFDVMGS